MINEDEIKKLKYYAKDFAYLMSDEDLEQVIVDLVEIKIERNGKKGWP
jgi:hypothetical protein